MEQYSEGTYNEVLFLGEWCKTYPYKKNPKVKSKTLEYHWDDRNKLENDFLYLENFYKKVLISLSDKLNFIHKKDYGPDFWEITIGYWLYNFIHVVFDRWEVLSKLNYSKEDVCNIIKSKVPGYIYFSEIGEDKDKRDYVVSYKKISKTGFKLQYSIDQGIDELIKTIPLLDFKSKFFNAT